MADWIDGGGRCGWRGVVRKADAVGYVVVGVGRFEGIPVSEEFMNVSSQFDTDYNMPHNEFSVNARNTADKEWRDTNGVHPNTTGYYQIADVVFRNFVANFCQ